MTKVFAAIAIGATIMLPSSFALAQSAGTTATGTDNAGDKPSMGGTSAGSTSGAAGMKEGSGTGPASSGTTLGGPAGQAKSGGTGAAIGAPTVKN